MVFSFISLQENKNEKSKGTVQHTHQKRLEQKKKDQAPHTDKDVGLGYK
jgi:hypothetical protein